ncbi:class I SAM-dependent methyltransferase [archaeon]|nr:class I SAM-dependent methyltransferase [archaeon]
MKKPNQNFHACDHLRFAEMRKLVKADKGKTILDIGGGLYSIAKGLPSKETIILDGDKKFKPTIVADFNNPLPIDDSSVDIVIAGEIIEHLINPFRFLLEIKRVLKSGGQLVLSTPNEVDLKSRIKVLFGKLPTNCARAFATEEDQIFNHKADYNWQILKEMVEKAGFKVNHRNNTGIFIGSRLVIPPKICPLTFGEKIIVEAIKIK